MTTVTDKGWTLRYATGPLAGLPVQVGAGVDDFRGDPHVVRGGVSPHKGGSTGRVSLSGPEDSLWHLYYPSVVDLVWVEDAA